MNKQEYKKIQLREKIMGKKRIANFLYFALFVIPIFLLIGYVFSFTKINAFLQILIFVVLMVGLWFAYLYGIVKPIEKKQQSIRILRQQEKDAKENEIQDGQN